MIKIAYWLIHNEYLDGRSIIRRDAANTWEVDTAFKPLDELFSIFLGSITHDMIVYWRSSRNIMWSDLKDIWSKDVWIPCSMRFPVIAFFVPISMVHKVLLKMEDWHAFLLKVLTTVFDYHKGNP
nr:hypothetical protein CFP56_13758 [Quercus suber]